MISWLRWCMGHTASYGAVPTNGHAGYSHCLIVRYSPSSLRRPWVTNIDVSLGVHAPTNVDYDVKWIKELCAIHRKSIKYNHYISYSWPKPALLLRRWVKLQACQHIHKFQITIHTLAPAEQLNAFANSGVSDNVPSTRNFVGECGSVRILWTADAGRMFLAQVLPKDMKKSWSLECVN